MNQHCEAYKHRALGYRRRRCQGEAPRGRPAPERSRTCWHSWVWPGACWSADSPSSPGDAARWCRYLTEPRAWAPAPRPPEGKMSPVPAPLANLEGKIMARAWRGSGEQMDTIRHTDIWTTNQLGPGLHVHSYISSGRSRATRFRNILHHTLKVTSTEGGNIVTLASLWIHHLRVEKFTARVETVTISAVVTTRLWLRVGQVTAPDRGKSASRPVALSHEFGKRPARWYDYLHAAQARIQSSTAAVPGLSSSADWDRDIFAGTLAL